MNILWKYTVRTLTKNKVRTVVTIIGIALSVALFTAVAEGFVSGKSYLKDVIRQTEGSYEVAVRGADKKTLDSIKLQDNINQLETINWMGFADIGSSNPGKPYLRVGEISDGFDKLVVIKLTEGRMPKNGQEILLPLHLYTDGGVEYKLGDTLELEIGDRVSDGDLLDQENEHVEGETLSTFSKKTYTVVGFCERLKYDLEQYSCPGYTALTVADDKNQTAEGYDSNNEASDEDIRQTDKSKSSGIGTLNTVLLTFNDVDDVGGFEEYLEANRVDYSTNTRLLAVDGNITDSGLYVIVYGLVGILFALIFVGSIMLIYNSFSISVSERTRQFGLLKSIGATRRQVLISIMYETVILCGIAIPLGLVVGCIGIGITLYLLNGAFGMVTDLAVATESSATMAIQLEPYVLAAIAVLGLVTTVISAMIPAVRMMRMNPIGAIKLSSDIKIRRRDTRTLGITGKILGFSGMLAAKNFKRSRKKYRTTVVSLSVSIVLFVSAASFGYYTDYSIDTITGDMDFDMQYTALNKEDFEACYDIIKAIPGVEDCKVIYEGAGIVMMDRRQASDYYGELLDGLEYDGSKEEYYPYKATIEPTVCIEFIDDNEFEKILRDNKISNKQSDKPVCILSDNQKVRETVDGNSNWSLVNMFRQDSFPMVIKEKCPKHIDGYSYYDTDIETSTDNKVVEKVVYMKEGGDPETDDSLVLDANEAFETHEHTIIGAVEERPAGISPETTLIYRYSDIDKIYTDDTESGAVDGGNYIQKIYFNSSDATHASIAKKITEYNNDGTLPDGYFYDYKSETEGNKAFTTILNVFFYGFVVLMSLIAIANVFNTVSTNILLRRREFAMLKSVGLSDKGMGRMMNYECILYGIKGLMYGIPLSLGVSYLIYQSIGRSMAVSFYVPVPAMCVSAAGIFVIIFITMVYSKYKIQKDNIIDALKNENDV